MTQTAKIESTDLARALECLRGGGVLLYPTDTVWGIGCDAANEQAVRRIFEIKQRAEAKAMISLVGNVAQFERHADLLPDVAYELLDQATAPLTLVVDHPRGLAPSLLAADGSAGLRVTSDAFSRELCLRLRRPVVSTSANISGQPTPRFFNEISAEVIKAMDYVVQHRQNDNTPHRSSAVIKLCSDSSFTILRK